MAIKEDYQQAIELAKQGRYEDARRLLIAYDHPKAISFVERMNSAIASSGIAETKITPNDKSFTVKLVFSILLLLTFYIPGLIATSIFAKEAKRYPNAPGAKAMILLNKILFNLLLAIVIAGFAFVGMYYLTA